jgi:hypothetical protein
VGQLLESQSKENGIELKKTVCFFTMCGIEVGFLRRIERGNESRGTGAWGKQLE